MIIERRMTNEEKEEKIKINKKNCSPLRLRNEKSLSYSSHNLENRTLKKEWEYHCNKPVV